LVNRFRLLIVHRDITVLNTERLVYFGPCKDGAGENWGNEESIDRVLLEDISIKIGGLDTNNEIG
jgi:hypothetical protein